MSESFLEQQISLAYKDRQKAVMEMWREECEGSLRDYVGCKGIWDIIEPGRQFVGGWVIDAICDHLQAVSEGHIRKLLINVPPGCMKSLTTCVLWPTWEWGPKNRPDLRYVCASYSDQLTIRDNRRARNIIASDLYQALWGDRFYLVGDQNAKTKYETNKTGFKIATSVGGLGTGERGDRVIIDDPHNVKEGESEAKREAALMWFSEVMPTRVTDPDKTAFVVIMQRVHERDVSGLILANELGYEHLMLPMEFEHERRCSTSIGFVDPRQVDGELLWPNRFSKNYLDNDLKPSLRAWGGSYAEAGQLQQRPTPRGGGMFQRKDFQFIEPEEVKTLRGRIVRGWDLAASEGVDSAYTAGVKGMIDQHGRLVVLDATRFQKLPGAVVEELVATAKQDGHFVTQDLPQDPGQAGKAQKAYLTKQLHGHMVVFGLESGDKVVRATPVASQAEGQNLYLVRGPWNDAYINEACVFPKGRFKDQVDATSRMYSNLLRRVPQVVGLAPKIIEG